MGEKKIGNFFETKVFERKFWGENFIENNFRRPQFITMRETEEQRNRGKRICHTLLLIKITDINTRYCNRL